MKLLRCERCDGLKIVGPLSMCAGCERAWWGEGSARLRPREAEVLSALLVRPGRIMSEAELVLAIYEDAEDGGPLYAQLLVRRFVWSVRRELEKAGCPTRIRNDFSRGYYVEFPLAEQNQRFTQAMRRETEAA